MYGKKRVCLLLVLAFLCVALLSACEKSKSDVPVAEEVHYDADGTVKSHTVYTYDEAGNRTEALSHLAPAFEDDEPMDLRYTYAYDADGNQTETHLYYSTDASTPVYSVTYLYDENGNLTETSEDGGSRSVYTYDEDGNLAEMVEYYKSGGIGRHYTYTYDENGRRTELLDHTDSGSVNRTAYTYDGAGRQTETAIYDAKGRLNSRIVNVYEDDKQTEMVCYDDEDNVYCRYVYEYDDAGRKVKETTYDADGALDGWTEYRYVDESA